MKFAFLDPIIDFNEPETKIIILDFWRSLTSGRLPVLPNDKFSEGSDSTPLPLLSAPDTRYKVQG